MTFFNRLLGDRGLALPPAKVMNALKTRRALFVEGREADFEEFILECGEIYRTGFKTGTRGITVFETGGATKQWPFDSIDYFQQLLGVDLQYLYVSDRDFLTDTEVAERLKDAQAKRRSIVHLDRRHRESYLVAPSVLARAVEKKWRAKHPADEVPPDCTADGINAFILGKAKELEDSVRAHLLVEHEPILRGTSDHRTAETQKLNEYFREAYTTPLGNGEIPFKLLDCKSVLKDFRTQIAEQHHISFSDRDILEVLTKEDLPSDLIQVLERILRLFAPAKAPPMRRAGELPGFFAG